MDFLLEHYESHKAKFRDNPTLSLMINSGWAKLDKYYRLSDQSPTYVVAIVLTPWFRWQYIDKNWLPEWNSKAKASIQELWERDYKPTNIPISTSSQPPPSSRSSKPANSYLEWRKKKTTSEATVEDEYSRYCKLPPVSTHSSRLNYDFRHSIALITSILSL